ncbi:hypothetical protein ACC713_29620 [Rhizobium johnstonii]|uniref:hypothetical protein n=1 Tax=Rhizobium johnstonii TaxID=3019933 RepID=UPI003F981117
MTLDFTNTPNSIVDEFAGVEWAIHFLGEPSYAGRGSNEEVYLDSFCRNLLDQVRAGALVGGYDGNSDQTVGGCGKIIFQRLDAVDWESRHIFSGSIFGIAVPIADLYFRSRQWNMIPTRNDYMFSDLFLFDGDEDTMELTQVNREQGDPLIAAGIPLFRGHPFTKIALFVNTLQHAKRVQCKRQAGAVQAA